MNGLSLKRPKISIRNLVEYAQARLIDGLEIAKEFPEAFRRKASGTLPSARMNSPKDIMDNLDQWVQRRSGRGYVPSHFIPGPAFLHGIQQVRKEISDFIEIIFSNDLHGRVLEIGMGEFGGTHILWRYIFNQIITIEIDPVQVLRFKMNECLDSRSVLISGNSTSPRTLRKVRSYADSVDVLFIDGEHTYNSVANDWSMYHGLVKPGGIIAFHDSVCQVDNFGVANFLTELSQGAIDGKKHEFQLIRHSDHVGISFEIT